MTSTNREWLDVPIDEYHRLDAISSSALRTFVLQGPLEYYARYVSRQVEPEETKAKRMGRVFHLAMERPADWRDSFRVLPRLIESREIVEAVNSTQPANSKASRLTLGEEINPRLSLHRAYVEMFTDLAARDGLEVLSEEEAETVQGQINAVLDNPAAAEYLGGHSEIACTATDPASGLRVKALCDLVAGDCIVDFKTTETRNPFDFARQAERYGYDFQAAHYLYVTGKEDFRFISVTNRPPFVSCVFYVPPPILERRMEQNLQSLLQIRQLHTMAELSSSRDSQGIPHDWMPEGWGDEYPLDIVELKTGRSL